MAQLIRRGRGVRLLLHPAPLIRQLDDKLSHALRSSFSFQLFCRVLSKGYQFRHFCHVDSAHG
jgi:hypothetical protein